MANKPTAVVYGNRRHEPGPSGRHQNAPYRAEDKARRAFSFAVNHERPARMHFKPEHDDLALHHQPFAGSPAFDTRRIVAHTKEKDAARLPASQEAFTPAHMRTPASSGAVFTSMNSPSDPEHSMSRGYDVSSGFFPDAHQIHSSETTGYGDQASEDPNLGEPDFVGRISSAFESAARRQNFLPSHEPLTHGNPPQGRMGSESFGPEANEDEQGIMTMMQGVQKSKRVIEEQRREIERLRSQLNLAASETATCQSRIVELKRAAKRIADASTQRVSDLEKTMADLRSESKRCFEDILRTSKSLPDLQDMRQTVTGRLDALSSLLDNEGQYSYGHLLKEELQDVKQKSANAEQVVEVLRERLQNVVAELDESKRRNVELEGIRAKDGEALRNLAASSEQRLLQAVEGKQAKLIVVLNAAAEAEDKLKSANAQVANLQERLQEKEQHAAELSSKYHVVVEERGGQLAYIESLEQSMVTKQTLETTVASQNLLIQELRNNILNVEAEASNLREQARIYEGQEDAATVENSRLGALLAEAKAQHVEAETVLRSRNEDLMAAEARALGRVDAMQRQVEEVAHQRDLANEKLQQLNNRMANLQESVAEQSITLSMTKESYSQLQERSSLTERELHSTIGDYKAEMASLKTLNNRLEARLQEHEHDLVNHQREVQSRVALEARLAEQEQAAKCLLEAAERREASLLREANDAKAAQRDLQTHVDRLEQNLGQLQHQLENRPDIPACNHDGEMQSLRETVRGHEETAQGLERTIQQLKERGENIAERYSTKDLSESEKKFIAGLAEKAESIHKRELAMKSNEIKRRDFKIKNIEARIESFKVALNQCDKNNFDPQGLLALISRGPIGPIDAVTAEDAPSTNEDVDALTPLPIRKHKRLTVPNDPPTLAAPLSEPPTSSKTSDRSQPAHARAPAQAHRRPAFEELEALGSDEGVLAETQLHLGKRDREIRTDWEKEEEEATSAHPSRRPKPQARTNKAAMNLDAAYQPPGRAKARKTRP